MSKNKLFSSNVKLSKEDDTIEAMLKHSNKKLKQRKFKMNEKHSNETFGRMFKR